MFNNLKIKFLSTFREFFLHHYTSLEFRAKMFALVIDGDDDFSFEYMKEIENIGMSIYNDKDRAKTLAIATEEFLKRVRYKNSYDVEYLINSIYRDLLLNKRYSNKISKDVFRPLLNIAKKEEDRIYQQKIVDFLISMKQDVEKEDIKGDINGLDD